MSSGTIVNSFYLNSAEEAHIVRLQVKTTTICWKRSGLNTNGIVSMHDCEVAWSVSLMLM